MKIAFYMTTILEHGGGIENYLIEVARNLSASNNIEIDIITMDNKFTLKIISMLSLFYCRKIDKNLVFKESLEKIKQRLGKARYYKCNSFKELEIKLNEYEVIYSKGELLEAFVFKFIIRYRRLPPIIFCCGTPIYYQITKSIQSKLHNIFYNSFVYKFLASGVKIFHVKNSIDEVKLIKLFPTKKIYKIYNPHDVDRYIQTAEKHEFNFNWDRDKYNVFWAGRLVEQKGVDELIKIIDEINRMEYKDKIVWNVAGDGIEKLKILALCNRWDNVNYFGHVANNYMPSIYKNNNLFISTSKWEGCPNNIQEAQAMNLPVISYDISGCNDIIRNNENGILVEDINSFVAEIKNFVNRKYLFQNISKKYEELFKPEIIYKNLVSMFKEYERKD